MCDRIRVLRRESESKFESAVIYLIILQTIIAYTGRGKQVQPSEVVSMDNSSVVRRDCKDTIVKHILREVSFLL